MYTYHASVLKVIDGDTVDIEIDLGFDIRTVQRVRLAGINAPEKNTTEGMVSKHWLEGRLPLGMTITVKSEKPGGGDKFGRYLAWIIDDQALTAENTINELMIREGLALSWDGKGVKPV